MRRIFALPVLLLCTVLPSAGQEVVSSPSISGSSISATLSVPGGYSADLTLSFEDVDGLSLSSVGLSVHLIDPSDTALLARLPASVVPGLPLLVRIEPPSAEPLSFRGIATVELHTHDLQYTAGTPLRLFSAPLGGAFKDVTSEMGAGSYRVRGTTGGFSEFLIVSDTRPLDQVIALKLDRLEALLEEHQGEMPGSVHDALENLLDAARAEYTAGATNAAIMEVDEFIELVVEHSATDIPNVWRSARDLENVAGHLRAHAMTLRFSLRLKRALGL